MRAGLRTVLRQGIERVLRPYGYRILKPENQYGIDVVADVRRLSKIWNVDMTLIFDVGANVGASSLAFRAAWPAGRVIAFEPNGTVARQLLTNVERVGDVSVEQVALGARSGQAAFFVYEDETVLSSLNERTPFTERFGLQGRPIDVNVTTLGDFCRARSIARINLLKIDAEGSDYDVLLGATDLLEGKQIDFVYCEFNSLSPGTERFGSLLPIAQLLDRHSYNFIASYNDYIVTEGRFFSVSNALFAADRGHS